MYTSHEALTRLTLDTLKSLMRWLPDASRSGRKHELVGAIQNSLAGEGLRMLWHRLDDTQRLAVAETVYAVGGLFHSSRFQAKYGQLPAFTVKEKGRSHWQQGAPSALSLFLYYQDGRYGLPSDLRERLITFVPKPDPVRLDTHEILPERIGKKLLTVRRCERDAIIDLPVLLRLADQGKIQVSDKTSMPSAATLRLLAEKLAGGDFYDPVPTPNPWGQTIGPTKAFAWPLLLQDAGLLQRHGNKQGLSPAGIKALSSAPADMLAKIWKKWLKSNLFDEFSRVDVIKGQKSQGRIMTALAPRRAAIDAMLRQCPIGIWVKVDDLSRLMQVTDHTFKVTHNPWGLYIRHAEYGSLGYDGHHDWEILQFRYMLCLLFEYAATLGMIDVAYVEPTKARHDYRTLWGADELPFLSRYDGLLYFRVNPLGAYCLGLRADYRPDVISPSTTLSVLPSLQINLTEGILSAEELLTLDTWAVQISDLCWKLDRQKTISAIEKGHDIAELLGFLKVRDDQPLPETVESFIKTALKQGKALKVNGTALLIDCEDAKIAELLSTHKETGGLCLRAGEKQLVVRLDQEAKFRSLIRILGFGMAS